MLGYMHNYTHLIFNGGTTFCIQLFYVCSDVRPELDTWVNKEEEEEELKKE